jgi:hypothetical protein
VPVAVSWRVPVLGTVEPVGVRARKVSVGAAVTVKVVLPLTVPWVALISEVPPAMPVARPPALMVAAAGLAEFQVTAAVRSLVVPSE